MGAHSTTSRRLAVRGLAAAVTVFAACAAAAPAHAQDRDIRQIPPIIVSPLPSLTVPVLPPGPDPVGGLTSRPVPPSVAGNDHDSCRWTNASIAECETTICLEPLDEDGDIVCHVITECYDHYGNQVPCP